MDSTEPALSEVEWAHHKLLIEDCQLKILIRVNPRKSVVGNDRIIWQGQELKPKSKTRNI